MKHGTSTRSGSLNHQENNRLRKENAGLMWENNRLQGWVNDLQRKLDQIRQLCNDAPASGLACDVLELIEPSKK